VHGSRPSRAAAAALIAASLAAMAAPASAQEMTHARFTSIMDGVFGRGAWRMTGGFRTPEREDQLRAQGAMTVRPGGLSRHSMGRPGAPGAFDLVVDGMSPWDAASQLRAAGAPFARYQPKGVHGSQGPHLHLEPYGFGPVGGPVFQTASVTKSKPVADGPSLAVTIMMPAASAKSLSAARQELARLRADAAEGYPEAQLELGRAYAFGYTAPRDFAAALSWFVAAARNPDADDATQADAASMAAQVATLLETQQAEPRSRVAVIENAATGR
jgi:TPR repeat protein